MQPKDHGKKVSDGQEGHQLAGNGDPKAVHAVSKRLEYGAHDNTVSSKGKAHTDNAQCRDTDGEHVRRSVEQQQKILRDELKE